MGQCIGVGTGVIVKSKHSTHGPPHGESAGSSGRRMGTLLLYGEALELVFVIVICLRG